MAPCRITIVCQFKPYASRISDRESGLTSTTLPVRSKSERSEKQSDRARAMVVCVTHHQPDPVTMVMMQPLVNRDDFVLYFPFFHPTFSLMGLSVASGLCPFYGHNLPSLSPFTYAAAPLDPQSTATFSADADDAQRSASEAKKGFTFQ